MACYDVEADEDRAISRDSRPTLRIGGAVLCCGALRVVERITERSSGHVEVILTRRLSRCPSDGVGAGTGRPDGDPGDG